MNSTIDRRRAWRELVAAALLAVSGPSVVRSLLQQATGTVSIHVQDQPTDPVPQGPLRRRRLRARSARKCVRTPRPVRPATTRRCARTFTDVVRAYVFGAVFDGTAMRRSVERRTAQGARPSVDAQRDRPAGAERRRARAGGRSHTIAFVGRRRGTENEEARRAPCSWRTFVRSSASSSTASAPARKRGARRSACPSPTARRLAAHLAGVRGCAPSLGPRTRLIHAVARGGECDHAQRCERERDGAVRPPGRTRRRLSSPLSSPDGERGAKTPGGTRMEPLMEPCDAPIHVFARGMLAYNTCISRAALTSSSVS